MGVSVAMATHNGARFLSQQLESIAVQTRRPDELVVADDASEDGTRELLARFARTAPFEVRVEGAQSALGVTQNFERALVRARGELIVLADQDDVWRPEKISVLASSFERDRAATLIVSDAEVVDESLRSLGYSMWNAMGFSPRERSEVRRGRAFAILLRHNFVAATVAAIRRAALERCLPFPRLHSAHDYWLGLILSAAQGMRIEERLLSSYRVHGSNLIGIRKLGLMQTVLLARRQGVERHFARNLGLFLALRSRIATESTTTARDLALLDEKIEHCRARGAMDVSVGRRLRSVAREAVSGRYGRFSYGFRSIAQDCLLRRSADRAREEATADRTVGRRVTSQGPRR